MSEHKSEETVTRYGFRLKPSDGSHVFEQMAKGEYVTWAAYEQLRAALDFYACPANYVRRDHYSTPHQDFPAWTEPSEVMKDEGAKAREVLNGRR